MQRRARARTSGEMSFFASLERCPSCQQRVNPDDLTIYGDGDAWSLTGPCRHCKGPLAFKFQTHGNPIEGMRQFGELGTGHSSIIAPKKFIDEIERLSPRVDVDPRRLSPGAWKVNRDTNKRVRVCLAELWKFIPAGADSIPAELLPLEDRSDLEARPDRYGRAWIEALIERHKGVSDINIADLPRIEAAEEELRLQRKLERKRRKGMP